MADHSIEFKSLRSFIGAKNYRLSREFYLNLGFEETIIDPKMSLFKVNGTLSFYLQDYYAKDWINNLMLFLEVSDAAQYETQLKSKDLDQKYEGVRFTEMKYYDWGREFFMHDPSGVLWHFGEFNEHPPYS